MNILNSAAKLVFLMLAGSVCAALFLGKVDPKDFILLTTMAFAFYYAAPNDNSFGAGK